jgi:hypothetical protein
VLLSLEKATVRGSVQFGKGLQISSHFWPWCVRGVFCFWHQQRLPQSSVSHSGEEVQNVAIGIPKPD